MSQIDADRDGELLRRSETLCRRAFLRIGTLGLGGLSLAEVIQSDAQAATRLGHRLPAKSVIILWMRGGPSQHDMWDPKPDAPAEIRGEFAPISTSVPGIQICELLPQCAKIMHKWAIVRSLHHRKEDGNVGHSDGDQICFTGYPAGSNPDVNVMPSCGSIVAKQLQHLRPELPAYVMIPTMVPGTGAAWLGSTYNPFETRIDPASPGRFELQNFAVADGLSRDRIERRSELLSLIDHSLEVQQARAVGEFQRRAMEIVTGGAAQKAFALDEEPAFVRQRYGFMPAFDPKDPQRCGAPNWAQRMLLARRLVEAGVRIVTVDLRWWDFHKQGFDSQKRGFLPRFDQAFSALVGDLEDRGLLDTTLIVAWGEIGRTPRVNKDAGRDHWPYVFSAALAGGGVRGGTVIGSSDREGALPNDSPKVPHDILATIYDHLGVDRKAQYLDHSGRPHSVLPEGELIRELFS